MEVFFSPDAQLRHRRHKIAKSSLQTSPPDWFFGCGSFAGIEKQPPDGCRRLVEA
jgi:hypothetical protein